MEVLEPEALRLPGRERLLQRVDHACPDVDVGARQMHENGARRLGVQREPVLSAS